MRRHMVVLAAMLLLAGAFLAACQNDSSVVKTPVPPAPASTR